MKDELVMTSKNYTPDGMRHLLTPDHSGISMLSFVSPRKFSERISMIRRDTFGRSARKSDPHSSDDGSQRELIHIFRDFFFQFRFQLGTRRCISKVFRASIAREDCRFHRFRVVREINSLDQEVSELSELAVGFVLAFHNSPAGRSPENHLAVDFVLTCGAYHTEGHDVFATDTALFFVSDIDLKRIDRMILRTHGDSFLSLARRSRIHTGPPAYLDLVPEKILTNIVLEGNAFL